MKTSSRHIGTLARRALPCLVPVALWAGVVLCAGLAWSATARASQNQVAAATADDAFLAAREAAKNGDLETQYAMGQKVRALDPGYPLTAYLDYWVISQRLHSLTDPVGDDTVRAFIAKNDGTLVADLARRDWLLALGRRGDLTVFAAEYPHYVLHDDAQVNCYGLMARYESQRRRGEEIGEALAAALRAALSVARDVAEGEGCATLAVEVAKDGQIGAAEIWSWMRAALDASQPVAFKRYAQLLTPNPSLAGDSLDTLYNKPLLWLTRQGDPSSESGQELVVLALSRLARSEPEQSAQLFERSWASRLSAQRQAYVWGELAAAASKKQSPLALDWARKSLPSNSLSQGTLAALARAALRAQDWALLAAIIDKMPDEAKRPGGNDGAWIYWLGRAKKAQGQPDEARALFLSLADQFSFYGQLATEELGQVVTIPPRALPVTDDELANVKGLPGFTRALKFYQLGVRVVGNAEWNFTLRGMSDRQLLAAAEWARRNDVLDRAVNTADRTHSEHDFTVRFLTPFRDALAAKVGQVGLDLDWVYGLIRQESRFVTVARSSVGASGLMQLMPATARFVARKIGMNDYQPTQVADLDTNLTLGTNYLRMVLDRLGNAEVLATAAYNAGPARSRAWQSSLTAPVEGAIFAETIPYPETRDYVKRVMSNAVYYAILSTPEKAQSLHARMGIIAPGNSSPSGGDLP